MIIDNDNKKLSQNRKRGNDRRNKIKDDLKLLLNKIKSEKKKKNKNIDKIKKIDILLVRTNYANKPDKLEKALRELNKKEVLKKFTWNQKWNNNWLWWWIWNGW